MDEYLKPLIETYHQNCNSEQAAAMSRYMQDLFPFLGIKTPLRRQLLKQFLQEYGIPSSEFLPELVQQLWELPEREFQYT
ncbi:MAG: DNA alkylation repair protein, partial [Candidatus Cloacimonetes bacterium]|nr:DNA alkylation repair protein [Candidatus Cloacimonadota bacterium]